MKKIFLFIVLLLSLAAKGQVVIPAGVTPLFGRTNAPDLLFTNNSPNVAAHVAIYDCRTNHFPTFTTNRIMRIVPIGQDATPLIVVKTNYADLVASNTIPPMSCGTFPARQWRLGCAVVSDGVISGGFSTNAP